MCSVGDLVKFAELVDVFVVVDVVVVVVVVLMDYLSNGVVLSSRGRMRVKSSGVMSIGDGSGDVDDFLRSGEDVDSGPRERNADEKSCDPFVILMRELRRKDLDVIPRHTKVR